MCARVCPTETLCEQACVREAAEGKPVRIGELQRYATDALMAAGEQPFARAAPTGKTGRRRRRRAGRAVLRPPPRHARPRRRHLRGAARRSAASTNTASPPTRPSTTSPRREVDFILSIGGITVETGKVLGRDFTLAELREDFDAVFLGIGLAGVNALGLAEEEMERRRRRGRLHRRVCARPRTCRRCRSAAGSSSSAAA